MQRHIRRIVTGHDPVGKAILSMQGEPPNVRSFSSAPGLFFTEVWNTSSAPAPVGNEDDPTLLSTGIPPPPNGSVIRIAQIPPERDHANPTSEESRRKHFEEMGAPRSSTGSKDAPHPFMHRTETIDYGIVIEGVLTLILDDSEVELRPGDVVVQRGTNHAWANRSDAPVLIAFILLDGQYTPEVAGALKHCAVPPSAHATEAE